MPMVEPKSLREIRERSEAILGHGRTSIIVIDNPPNEFIKTAAAAIADRAVLLSALDARNQLIDVIMPDIIMAEKILSQMTMTAKEERQCLLNLRSVIKALTIPDKEEED